MEAQLTHKAECIARRVHAPKNGENYRGAEYAALWGYAAFVLNKKQLGQIISFLETLDPEKLDA